MVEIAVASEGKVQTLSPKCLGTIISIRHVLTAGYKFYEYNLFSLDPERGAPRRLGGVVTVDVDTGLQPETGTTQLVDDNDLVQL